MFTNAETVSQSKKCCCVLDKIKRSLGKKCGKLVFSRAVCHLSCKISVAFKIWDHCFITACSRFNTLFYFFLSFQVGRTSKSCNLIDFESGRFFTILPANLGRIVGSFIHKFVCCFEWAKPVIFNHFSFKLPLLLGLVRKSEFCYSDKTSEGRIKQVS